MKRLFITVCGIAMSCNYVLAQNSDNSLARADQNKTAITTTTAAEKNKMQVVEINETDDDREETRTVNTSFKLPTKNSALDTKVGPNGEELFMKRNKYYYLDETGKKVKIKSSELRDRPKSS